MVGGREGVGRWLEGGWRDEVDIEEGREWGDGWREDGGMRWIRRRGGWTLSLSPHMMDGLANAFLRLIFQQQGIGKLFSLSD